MRGDNGMRFRGPGDPGGPGGPGGFGPGAFLAPSFLKGDQDHDGKLSKDEFQALGQRWFSEWDKNKSGQLDLDQLRTGMNSTLAPAGFRGPGGAGRTGGPQGPPLQGAEGHRNGLASASGIAFEYVHADLEFEGQLLRDVAVRYKGNGPFMESRR